MSVQWSSLTVDDHGRVLRMAHTLAIGWMLMGTSLLVLLLVGESSGSGPGAVFVLLIGLAVLLGLSACGAVRSSRRQRASARYR